MHALVEFHFHIKIPQDKGITSIALHKEAVKAALMRRKEIEFFVFPYIKMYMTVCILSVFPHGGKFCVLFDLLLSKEVLQKAKNSTGFASHATVEFRKSQFKF
jgi:hypothetical protein